MTAYYNDNDPAACEILRHMIKIGVIAPGVVDERKIEEVTASDLIGFTQCHFFAGGGFWSIACRMAGWDDNRPIWTASCPCQPWSGAGQGNGFDDPRHLWPHLHRIMYSARQSGHGPTVIVGEQVASKLGRDWFDRVRLDLDSEGIKSRCVDFPACAVNAPHRRQRLYWVGLDVATRVGSQMASNAQRFGGTGGHRSIDIGPRSNGHDRMGDASIHGFQNGAETGNGIGSTDEGFLSVRSNQFHSGDVADRQGVGGRTGYEPGNGRVSTDLFGERMADTESGIGRRGEPQRGSDQRTADRRSDAWGVTMGHAIGEGLERFDGYGDSGWGSIPTARRSVAATDDPNMVDASIERWGEGRTATGIFGRRDAVAFTDLFGVELADSGREGRQDAARSDLYRSASGERSWDGESQRPYGADIYRSVWESNYWTDAEWIECHDGKARRTKPGIRFLVDGLPGRVDLWGVAGNAIVPQAAAEVIKALRETLDEQ